MKSKSLLFLVVGFSFGLAIALVSLMRPAIEQLPDDAVARVNNSHISRASYERAISAINSDKRAALNEVDRRHILHRLIDEELLIQYGIRQGLVRSDGRVKASLVQAVIATKRLLAESREIPHEEALDFFNTNQKLFSHTERLRVGLIRIPASNNRDLADSKVRAHEVANKLNAGSPFYGTPPAEEIRPNIKAPLLIHKETVEAMAPGSAST